MWGQVLRGKYGRGGWSQSNITANPSDSSLWKAIARSWPELELHRCWSVGNGNKVKFWDDKWIDDNSRLSDLALPIPEETRGWMVKDVALPTGEWNFDLLQQYLPSSTIQKLHAIVPPHASNEEDKQFWPGTTSGQFTASSAYYMLTKNTLNDVNKRWKEIWKIESIERIRVFVWLLVHDRLLTKSRLARWQLGNPYCHHCHQFEETTTHVMRDCPIAVNIWRHLLPIQDRGKFFTVDFQEWIQLNLSSNFGMNNNNDWKAIWATACFLLWQWRNKSMHDEDFISPERPWQVILDYVSLYKFSMRAEDQIEKRKEQRQVEIGWITPSHGWFALNSDGAMKAKERRAGCGGVLRSDTGVWIEGFAKALGDTTAYMAELWGIYEGLSLAHRRGVTRLEIRTDSQVIAHSLQNKTNGSIMGGTLIRKIRDLLNGPWEVKIIHVYREANRCADMLANMGSEGIGGIEFFVNPPDRVRQIVREDSRGVSFPV
jgi:ribonuclease HI